MLALKIILLVGLSPLLNGIITKFKNYLRFRRGSSIFQPYYNLAKYFRKNEVISEHASWLFFATPYIVFAATVSAASLLPSWQNGGLNQYIGDFLAMIFLLALGRFFLALAGLDPATTFGGMGASREMFIASFIEPVVLLIIFALALAAGTTNLTSIALTNTSSASSLMAVAALFLIALAETGRLPIDNQETHLELTMIHEAMLLEYSGRSLAMLELAAYVKQMLFFFLLAIFILPVFNAPLYLLIKILLLAALTAFTEITLAKMRLFRVVDFLSFAGILALLAIIAMALGV